MGVDIYSEGQARLFSTCVKLQTVATGLKKVIEDTYVIPKSERFFDGFTTFVEYSILVLAIIFRPLNIIAIGVIIIVLSII